MKHPAPLLYHLMAHLVKVPFLSAGADTVKVTDNAQSSPSDGKELLAPLSAHAKLFPLVCAQQLCSVQI